TDALLQQAQARNGKELSDQLEQACANLKIIQKGIEASVSESLKTHAVVAVKTFEQTIDDVAQHSAAQWRQKLASGLNSVIKSLGEQFRFEAGPEEGCTPPPSARQTRVSGYANPNRGRLSSRPKENSAPMASCSIKWSDLGSL